MLFNYFSELISRKYEAGAQKWWPRHRSYAGQQFSRHAWAHPPLPLWPLRPPKISLAFGPFLTTPGNAEAWLQF